MNWIKIDKEIINLGNVTHISIVDKGVIRIYFNSNIYVQVIGDNATEYVLDAMKKYYRLTTLDLHKE